LFLLKAKIVDWSIEIPILMRCVRLSKQLLPLLMEAVAWYYCLLGKLKISIMEKNNQQSQQGSGKNQSETTRPNQGKEQSRQQNPGEKGQPDKEKNPKDALKQSSSKRENSSGKNNESETEQSSGQTAKQRGTK